ncbi:uncharacterized protein BDZ99DRAFT_166618 [Mytilinidion resinicola]|uniref:Uncharacterized protein n=1 Tax=Mytilinidion resinicola TaxID=574789 RepID=A0A6A6Y4I3_9PEZI|nr:uncharacterized protein BDZ99DRAFT_166618 [Mytilinidion resinicola]KAF2803539.1 hypothetical protein BDZ99DRAFT_166618 [Mytilinidion resinicola]
MPIYTLAIFRFLEGIAIQLPHGWRVVFSIYFVWFAAILRWYRREGVDRKVINLLPGSIRSRFSKKGVCPRNDKCNLVTTASFCTQPAHSHCQQSRKSHSPRK